MMAIELTEREQKLPQWAQRALLDARRETYELEGLRQLHRFLAGDNRTWFVLNGPKMGETPDSRSLFILEQDAAFCVCRLYCGDTLFVGRAKRQ